MFGAGGLWFMDDDVDDGEEKMVVGWNWEVEEEKITVLYGLGMSGWEWKDYEYEMKEWPWPIIYSAFRSNSVTFRSAAS